MVCWRAFLSTLCLTFALAVGSTDAQADERILSFVSDVTINQDASLNVTETIRVRSEGQQIKRGIVREFPTSYRDRGGTQFRVGFEVLSVRRDGKAEDFHIKKIANGKAVYIGNADRFLTPGTYAFEITYRTTRQLGHFEVGRVGVFKHEQGVVAAAHQSAKEARLRRIAGALLRDVRQMNVREHVCWRGSELG